MRLGILLLLSAAVPWAQDELDNFRWELWRKQIPTVSIAEAPLPVEGRSAVRATLVEMLKRKGVTATLSIRELEQLANSTRVKLIDVTGDGVPDVIAEGGAAEICSPTGNCPWWVLTKQGSLYSPILESFGNGLSTNCRPSKGQCDIVVFMHGSATELSIKLYRLANRRYRRMAAYDAVWPQDEDGRTARTPAVTRVH